MLRKTQICAGLILALLSAGVASAAEPLRGTFSGSSAVSSFDVDGDGLPGFTGAVGGRGTFGPWTGTTVSETGDVTGLCGPTSIVLEYHTWSTVQRFRNGDLIYYALEADETSSLCFDFVSGDFTFEIYAAITGGTGRFLGANGQIVLTGTGKSLLVDVAGNGVHSGVSGKFTGEISRGSR